VADGQIQIRKLEGTDEADLCARLMAGSEPWITLGRSYEDSLKILVDKSKDIYVARVDQVIVGFIIINMNGSFVGYIQTVCVKPEMRNKGIGSILLNWAEQRIFSETPNVFMCVSSFNKEALKLYEKLGYEVIGELRDYIVAGHSEILLRKTIAPMTEFKAG
jgi:ribosomal-protein-alanine N-acetyltransferase